MVQVITLPVYTIVPHAARDWGGNLKFALNAKEMSIINPFESECGRFEVDPVTCYGISLDAANQLVDLNNRLAIAYSNAVDAVAQAYQKPFGVEDGGAAGNYFDGGGNLSLLQELIVRLVCNEFEIPFSRA